MVLVNIQTDHLLKALKELPQSMPKSVMKEALEAASKPIVQEAQKHVSSDNKELRESIGIVERTKSEKTKTGVAVTPIPNGTYDEAQAYLLEFGTATVPAQPFMRPAFENQGQKAIKIVKEHLEKQLNTEMKKVRR